MKYVANPVEADAYRIVVVNPPDKHGNVVLKVEGISGYEERIATPGMVSRYMPVPEDYWVVQEDGYVYLNPKAVFERKYRPMETDAKINTALAEACSKESDNTCFEKAKKRGDLTFTLVGQDLSAPTVICEWIKDNIENSECSAEKLNDALRTAILMRDRNYRKHAD